MSERQLWSINSLAIELNRDPRTVKKALERIDPDGMIGRHPAWFLTSATQALAPVERRFRSASRDDEAAADDVEAVWGDLRRGFTNLEREQDIDRRRVMAQDVGPLIKELESALNALWRTPEDKLIFTPLKDKLIAVAISELARLCEAKLQDTPDGVQLVVP
jgi:hypothetical protein